MIGASQQQPAPPHPYTPHKCVSRPWHTFPETVSHLNLKTTDEFRYDGLPVSPCACSYDVVHDLPVSQVDDIIGADRVATPEPDSYSGPGEESARPNSNAFHFSFGSSGGQGQNKVESRPPPSCVRNQRPTLLKCSSPPTHSKGSSPQSFLNCSSPQCFL